MDLHYFKEVRMHKSLRTIVQITGILALIWAPSFSQAPDYYGDEPAGSLYEFAPRDLIDAPTAGTLQRGSFDIVMRVYNNGGILASAAIGLSNSLMIGMSYGAEGIISDRTTTRNPQIEFQVKLKLISEEYLLPAFAIGFISQGYGSYLYNLERYTFKSKGFFGVVSRSFYLGNIGVGGHVGINYSLENDVDKDEEPSIYFGLDARFAYDIGFIAEYDMALNDDRGTANYAKGRGYLSLGLKWLYKENLELELILRDLLINRRGGVTTFGRELRFTYIEFF